MAEFLEILETIRHDEASVQKLFGGEGQSARPAQRGPRYMAKLAEAAILVADVYAGKKPVHYLREAMTTSDFPYLFGDILDRQLLAAYRETPQVFRNFCAVKTVPDFRTVRRYTMSGAESVLDTVAEQGEYTESALSEDYYEYSVKKYGRRIPFSWEAMINDDLDALKDVPARFGRASRRTESKFATELYVDSTGPHASLYDAATYGNVITGNPALSVAALQTAMQVLAAQTDSDGEPIVIETVEFVVPPALEITAQNILNALQLELIESGGTTNQKMIVANWMRNRMRLSVDPYIPIVATTNGNTSWFLFANPGNGRPALEMGFLRGHEAPEIFIKAPNAQRVGGGQVNPMDGDFDTDSIQYKVRHVLGGTRMDPKMTVGSEGDNT